MFTGFASENTPAIQVWDFFRAYTGTARISLADDCAPIQFVRTSGNTTTIELYLPTSPIEGKQIKIINARYGSANAQSILIHSSDANGNGSEANLALIGPGQTIDFCYSKNFISFGLINGQVASGWITLNQTPASSGNQNSVVLGGYGNSAQLDNSVVIGGQLNLANGQRASVIAGQSNTASGSTAAVVGGSNNTASQVGCIVAGGASNSANNTYASVFGGSSNNANSLGATVVGGENNTASGSNAAVIGGAGGLTRSIIGNFVTSASNTPIALNAQQLATLLLGSQTTNATATILRSNTSAASTTNQVILPNNSAYYVRGSIIATVTGGGNTKSWDFIATIKRGANAAATSIVGAVTLNVQAADAGASTWVVAITADTTNGGIAVTVTGQAATTIRWVAKLESTEVTY